MSSHFPYYNIDEVYNNDYRHGLKSSLCTYRQNRPGEQAYPDNGEIDQMAQPSQQTQKHLCNICSTSAQRLLRWSNIVQMLCKCFVFTGFLTRDLNDSWSRWLPTTANKSMTIIIAYISFIIKCSICIYFIGFYAFQSVFFATIYNNMYLFYLWFWRGNIYHVYYLLYFYVYTVCTWMNMDIVAA